MVSNHNKYFKIKTQQHIKFLQLMKKNNKKQYASPVLKKFGAVAKLTMKGGSLADGGPFNALPENV